MMSLLGIPARLRDAYPAPLRAAMSLLWLAGALLALITTPLALAHEASPAVALVAAVLIALAIATWLRAWWALGVSFAVSGLQVFGVIGSLAELIAGIGHGDLLRDDPTERPAAGATGTPWFPTGDCPVGSAAPAAPRHGNGWPAR